MAVILIVDDNRDERKMLETLVRHYTSHDVIAVEGAREAYREAGKADLIMLDVMMPGEDGVTALRKLKANSATSRIPVIMMSAYPDSIQERLSPAEFEGIEVLAKPVNPDMLSNRLSSLLGMASARQRLAAEGFAEPEQLTILLAAIGQTGDGITLTDEKGRWLFTNRAEHEMFGYSHAEFENLTPQDIYSAESLKTINEEALARLNQEGHWEGELTGLRKGGQPFPVLLSLTQVQDDSGKFLGVMGITKDISVLRQAFSDLQQAQEALVRSERLNALGGMIEGISHQFNNILANILGNSQLLLQGTSDPLSQKRLRSIERAVISGAEAVRSLQTFTLRDQDGTRKELDLESLLEEVMESTRPRWRDIAQRRGLSIRVQKNLQPGVFVEGNHDELINAFSNIIFNAIEALVQGGNIVLQSWEENGRAYARITDNGKGMTPDVLEKAFEPFFTTERPDKVGMGLSEAYGIIKKHGGNIVLESTPDRGTTVTVSLPGRCRQVEAEEAVPLEEALVQADVEAKVIVVDDDESVLDILSQTLARAGYKVTGRRNPVKALEDIEGKNFDLVITNLGMSEINGLELARRTKELSPGTKVALITGWKSTLDPKNDDLNAVDVIWGKPFDINRLLKESNKLLRG